MEEKVKELNQLLNDYIVKKDLEEHIVFQNIDKFYNLTKNIYPILKDFNENVKIKVYIQTLAKTTPLEMLEIIKKFYNEYNINLNIDLLTEQGVIDFILTNTGKQVFQMSGVMHKDNETKLIDANNNGLIIDIPILVHELGHYRNINNGEVTQVNNLLTESLARTDELLITDYLEHNNYEKNMNAYKIRHLKQTYKTIYYKYVLFKLLYLYKILGDVSKQSYLMLFKNDNDYEKVIDFAVKIFKQNDTPSLIMPASYLLDTYLSSYLLLKYKSDNGFLNRINLLNDMIKTKSLSACLKLIGLNDFGKEDQEILLKSVKEMLESVAKEETKDNARTK